MPYAIGTKVRWAKRPKDLFEIIGDKNTPYKPKFATPPPDKKLETVEVNPGQDYLLRAIESENEFDVFESVHESEIEPVK